MTSRPLLETPDYSLAMEGFVREAVNDRMATLDPIYGSLRRVPFPEGVDRIRVDVEGGNNESPEVEMSEIVEVQRDDVVEGNFERLHEIIEQIAESHLPQFMRPFFEYVGDSAASVGNAIDLSGTEFNLDRVLDAHEMVEWAVGEDGVVRPPQLVASPEVIAKVLRFPPPTPEQENRMREMAARKQEDHASRRRRRRLR
jgi:hypothetical protein